MVVVAVRPNLNKEQISEMYAKELGLKGKTSAFTDKFAEDILNRDFGALQWINNGLNDKAKKIFSYVTGYKLPKTQKGTLTVMLQWAKIDWVDYDIEVKQKMFNKERDLLIENCGVPVGDLEDMFIKLKENGLFDNYEDIRGGIRLSNQDRSYCDLKSKGVVKLRPVIKAWVAYMKAVEFKELDGFVNQLKAEQK